jgi:hypothetical protein
MPAEFLDALSQSPKAAAFYATLNKAHRYAIFYRLTSAKRPETRQRRLVELIALLARGERLRGAAPARVSRTLDPTCSPDHVSLAEVGTPCPPTHAP